MGSVLRRLTITPNWHFDRLKWLKAAPFHAAPTIARTRHRTGWNWLLNFLMAPVIQIKSFCKNWFSKWNPQSLQTALGLINRKSCFVILDDTSWMSCVISNSCFISVSGSLYLTQPVNHSTIFKLTSAPPRIPYPSFSAASHSTQWILQIHRLIAHYL